MQKLLCFLVLALFTFSSKAMDAQTVCESLQPVVTQLRAQLPQDVDYLTKLVGVQLFYVNNHCFLNYSYVVASAQFLTEMAEENQHSEEDNLAFLQTSEGEQTLSLVFGELATHAASNHFAAFNHIKGIKITFSHSFDNTKIRPVVTTVLNTTD